MNARILIASAILAVGTAPVLASEATEFPLEPSTLTRAEVRAELARALAAGEPVYTSEAWGSFAPADIASTRTRPEMSARSSRLDPRDANLYSGG